MSTRLGIDMGTNSIGWCLLDGNKILDAGSRIFSDGREAKSGESLAVSRRTARSMRRRRDRFLRRRSVLLEALEDCGLMPANSEDAKALVAHDPYELRTKALDAPLDPHDLGRALFHLNQRRGFKSNRKTERKAPKEDGVITAGTKALDLAMQEAGARTLGEFLHGRPTKRIRLRPTAEQYDFYPDRRHLEDEFGAIWAAQAVFHPELLTDAVKDRLHRIIFFQRPLKTPEVGRCAFSDEPRLPKAHPLFQRRRLYEEVNHLRIVHPGQPDRALTLDERDKIVLKLKSTRKTSFDSLAKLIKLGPDDRFNKASEQRKDLAGDEVFAEMSAKTRFDIRWAHFSMDQQWQIIERVAEEEDPEKLYQWLAEHHNVPRETAEALGRASLPEGHGRLGATATAAILEELQKDVITYDEAVKRAGWHHSQFATGEVFDQLPYYGRILDREIPPGSQNPDDPDEIRYGRITNPTVHIGLRQLQKLINAIERHYGRPDHIVVELARDLKSNEKKKDADRKLNAANFRAAQGRSTILNDLHVPDTGANRALLKLWEELNPNNAMDRCCPYCGGSISMRMLFSDETDVDHILPYSKTLDDGNGNKVVAHRHCNRQKTNQSPWEAWGGTARWDTIAIQVKKLDKAKQWRFSSDAWEKVERDGGFVARQLTDTQYLARATRTYLSALYPDQGLGSRHVHVIPGRMTAMLRRLWGLNDLLPDHNYVENRHSDAPKNRLDHRHHAIDAAVAAVTTESMLHNISKAAGLAEAHDLDAQFEALPAPWEGFRDELRDKLARVVVSHKADHGRNGRPDKRHDVTSARLHNDSAYGLTGLISPKGLPIVVHRIGLGSLAQEDLADEETIPDKALRDALRVITAGKTDKAFTQSLMEFSQQDGPFKGLRHVRVREALNVIRIKDRQGRVYKGFKGDANARYDVWRLPDGKWESKVISMFDAHQKEQAEQRPHPAAKKTLSLRQNDLIAVERKGGAREILRVVKFSGNGAITFCPPQEAGALKNRDANKDDPFKYIYASAKSLNEWFARQIRINELGHVFDPGPR